jgi:hypothetical protein
MPCIRLFFYTLIHNYLLWIDLIYHITWIEYDQIEILEQIAITFYILIL